MDLTTNDEFQAVAELARDVGLDLLAPAARDAEQDAKIPEKAWSTLYATGLTAPVAEQFGGDGVLSTLSRMIAVRNLAFGDAGITMAAVWSGAVAALIGEHGTDAQKQALSDLANDPKARCGLALYEGYGRGLADLATTIAVQGDTVHVVGHKRAVPFAAVADPLLVIGRDPDSSALRAVLLTSADEGVVSAPAMCGLGLDATEGASVAIDAMTTSAHLLGGPYLDPDQLTASVQQLRLLVAAAMLGTAQRAIEYAAEYATTRVAFGSAIASFQGVSFPLVNSLMRIDASQLEIFDVASCLDRALDFDHERHVAQALDYACRVAVEATRQAVQTLGGHGFIRDHPVELWYRSAMALAALDFDPSCGSFEPVL